MNRLKPFILVGVCACILSPSKSQSALMDILSKYCVPTSASDCTGASRAMYNGNTSGNTCECSSCNMYYDKNTRTCQNCATGTYVTSRSSTECIRPTCSSGQYSEIVSGSDTCPFGYYREVLSTCK